MTELLFNSNPYFLIIYNFVKAYWFQILAFMFTFVLSLYIFILQHRVELLRTQKEAAESYNNTIKDLLLANEALYEINLETAKRENTKVKTEYITKIKYIDKWSDKNVSCTQAMSFINNYPY